MAFIGLFAVMTALIAAIIFLGVVPIIAGTLLIRRTKHKKLGTAVRIFGYAVILPIVITGVTAFLIK